MRLLEKLYIRKEEKELKDALKYLYNRLKVGRYENITLQDYFLKDYRANCYYYSTYIFLCMKPTDRLCRGKIHLEGDHDFISRLLHEGKTVPNYEHGWVEFEYNGKWWVYDDHYNNPIPLEEWEKQRKPFDVYQKFTREELVVYLTEKYKDKITILNDGNKVHISSSSNIWDSKYSIPFPYIDAVYKNGNVKRLEIDTQRKVCHC